jgi:hypothetical protein
MIENPSIDELWNSGNYELARELRHSEVKEFVVSIIKEKGRFVRIYSYYQAAMILIGFFTLGLGIGQAFKGKYGAILYIAGAIVFCFSVLIVLHELLHGFAFKIVGVPKVSYGAYFKKMMFYAEADRFVLNRKQFTLVALFPLFAVKLVSVAGIFFFFNHPAIYFFIILMCLHSLFCAGDIALLSFFYKWEEEVFTFDIREEKKSYYFKRKEPPAFSPAD